MRAITKALLATLLAATPAFADDPVQDPVPDPAAPAPVQVVPAAQPEPAPLPPAPVAPSIEETSGQHAVRYGQLGVREIGGSTGLTIASNLRDINFSPSFGYFMQDNFELSGILSVSNIKAGNESSTVWSALIEPSFHIPIDHQLFGFVGVGVGAAYIDPLGTALAIAPRVGMNFLVGRSGILTPCLSYEYTTHNAMSQAGADGTTDVTLLAVSSTLRANIGYTVMW